MGKHPHIIGRTVLELDSGNRADVWELQETMGYLLQQRAMSELETLFDSLAGVDEVIRFDQVTVDLGAIAPNDLDAEFVPALVRALQVALGDQLMQASLPTYTDPPPIRQPRTGADWEVLLYFLQYGRLPWWQTETHWSTWLTRWHTVIAQSSSWQQPLLQHLSEDAVAQRLTQFPPDFCHPLIRQLHPSGITGLTLMAQAHQLTVALGLSTSVQAILDTVATQLILDELRTVSSPATPFPAFRWMQRWLAVLQQLRSAQPTVSPSIWMRRWINNLRSVRSFTPGTALTDGTDRQMRAALKTMPAAEQALWQRAMEQVFLSNRPPADGATVDGATVDGATVDGATVDGAAADSNPLTNRSPDGGTLVDGGDAPFSSPDPEEPEPPVAAGTRAPGEIELPPGESDPRASGTSPPGQMAAAPGDELDPREPETSAPEETEPSALANEAPQQQAEEMAGTAEASSSLDVVFSNSPLPYTPVAERPVGPVLSPEEIASGLYINQAGLVLLHPFLAAYFRKMGLVENDAFCDDIAQQTAIYLLHYLVTGQRSAPEYDLVLPKLLCGWPLNDAIATDIPLTDDALTEADNLLQTVINYWDALKNTSPDGLREGFLQREGKLTPMDGQGWKLQVEQMAIDVLLTRLPWGVSMVKLPWMDELLTVEWT